MSRTTRKRGSSRQVHGAALTFAADGYLREGKQYVTIAMGARGGK